VQPLEQPSDVVHRRAIVVLEAAERTLADVHAEPPVGFELALVEPLIGGGLVRELRHAQPVLEHVVRLVAGDRGF
jgi:hypothetical protein